MKRLSDWLKKNNLIIISDGNSLFLEDYKASPKSIEPGRYSLKEKGLDNFLKYYGMNLIVRNNIICVTIDGETNGKTIYRYSSAYKMSYDDIDYMI